MGDSARVIEMIQQAGVLPVVVIDEPSSAPMLMKALIAGGLNCAEVTLRTPNAEQCIREMAGDSDFVVGAGTVLTPDQADRAIAAGAQFIVSPGISEDVIEKAQGQGIPVFPGIATATEIQRAVSAGIEIVKLFPAEPLGGPEMVRALAAPFPSVRFIPTGGISVNSLPAYLDVPAVLAVGGSWLVARSLLDREDWSEITRRTRNAVRVGNRLRAPRVVP